YARLRDDILTGALRPGQALSETRLASEHGISRTPVREVFQRLVGDGLLRVVPQVGSFVAPINLAAVADSQFIRESLECHAVARAAERISDAQARTLRRQVSQQARVVQAGDQNGFFRRDEEMHRFILTIAGHPSVWDLIASVKAQLDRVRHLSLEDRTWLSMIFRQHQEIAEHLTARDAAAAAAAMKQHLRTVFAAIERIADRHPDFFEHPPAHPTANPLETA
ncbi:MAG TPA: GntR family transcriptional regulator, partial [Rhodopila sp.]|uniref:GntR family transcriptional regulator n=1 Tax=Rhodopila sp. TaxID=2480087 RepID=UPI002C8B89CD